ncbi:MAG: hypothetical protein LRY71_14665 [Bacillaceae bacterium]|nr:hypothetical protein [Bacillaceae bacterium]
MRKIIQTLKANETIKEFFLLTSLQSKLGKNGTYFEMVLSDASGEIKARKWDLTEKDYQLYETVRMELPKVVLVKGFTREFQQSIDLKVFYIVIPMPFASLKAQNAMKWLCAERFFLLF